jgi:hypothetical protein
MRILCALVFGVLLVAARAWAVDLVSFDEDVFPGHPRGFYDFNTTTGTTSLRAAVAGTTRFSGIDQRPSDGAMFAVDPTGGLWNVNVNTGATTEIGNTGLSELFEIAINPITGAMVALQEDNPGSMLYSINPTTSVPTLIGYVEVQSGLAFSPAGQLYAFDTDLLYKINPATGAAQRVMNPGPAGPLPQNITDGAFTPDGQYFIQDFDGNVAEVDPATGGGTIIGMIPNGGTLGLVAVPEPCSVELAIIAALLGAIICAVRAQTSKESTLRPSIDLQNKPQDKRR